MKKNVLMSCLAATLLFALEKTTELRARDFSHRPVAATQLRQSQLPRNYAAADVKVLGDLDYGQTSGSVLYSARPPYRAFVFSAFGGEKVEITVKGTDRKAYVVLTDSSLHPLASGATSLTVSLPNRGPYIECWYIVFRDFNGKPARFTVEVKKLENPSLAAARQGAKAE